MTVEKIAFRLAPRDMCRPEDGTFQTSYEARVDRPLGTIDLDEVFTDVGQGRLEPGDQITFCAFEGTMLTKDRRLREVGVCRIVAKVVENGRPKIKAAWVGAVYQVPEPEMVAPKEQKYKLEIKGTFEGDFLVLDEKGNTIERVDTQAEAEAFVAAYDGRPKRGRPPKGAKESKSAAA